MVVIFSVLVIAHELGHFLAARRGGVKVEEFGIGFPPRLFKIRRGGTIYSINLFPIGGFVRLKGEDSTEKGPDSFATKSYKTKAKIVLAGVAVNFVIAYVLFYVLMVFGLPAILPNGFVNVGSIRPDRVQTSPLLVLSVRSGSAADQAGIKVGNEIISFNGEKVTTTERLQSLTKQYAGQQIDLGTAQRGVEQTKKITLGSDQQEGYLGVASQPVEVAYYNPLKALVAAFIALVQLVLATLAAFGEFIVGLFTKARVSENVAGPVGIASIFTVITKFGWKFVLAFTASISLSLAVINSLPLPALDGGRFAIMSLNRMGVKISPEKEALAHWLGFGFLIILIIIVTISDISRL
jgi:regulator of sigma E protease